MAIGYVSSAPTLPPAEVPLFVEQEILFIVVIIFVVAVIVWLAWRG